MGLEILTLGSSKTYTKESLLGGGAVVGKNVTISSITPIDGGNRVTFSYTLDNGTVKTSTMDVMDGKDGQQGVDGVDGIGISKIEKIGTVDLIDTYRITFTDNTSFYYDVTNGVDGKTPSITIEANDNWFVDGIDTGIKAKGEKGDTGSGFNTTRQYSSVSDMMADTNPANDSEIVVVVLDDVGNFYMRLSSYVDPDGITNGYLPIGSAQDISTIKGEPGKDGTDGITPHIDSATKHWFLGTTDTGVTAEGKDGTDGDNGTTPHIDKSTKNWFIGDVDTGVLAEGINGNDGVTPHIDSVTKHWFIGTVDTGILAEADIADILSIGENEPVDKSQIWIDTTYNDNPSLKININGDWFEMASGKVIINLDDVLGPSITTYKSSASLMWADPEDVIRNNVTVQEWAGTLVVRKEGSVPRNKDDGTIVVDNDVKDAYSSTAFVDTGLEYGKTYYYRFFPYSPNAVYTKGTSISVTPEKVKINTIPSQSSTISYTGSEQAAVFNNYDENELEVIGNTATDVGIYTATFTPKYDYCWSDGTIKSKDVTWEIIKGEGNVTLSSTEVTLNEDNNFYATIDFSDNTGDVTVISGDTVYLDATLSNNVITLTTPNTKEGTLNTYITINIAETENYNASSINIPVKCVFTDYEIVTFADGTWEQLESMINAHYKGKINISDYWAVGDTRTIDIAEMTATYVGEAQPAQTATVVIIGFDHDNLINSINGKTKAAVTLQLKNKLTNNGYMNPTKVLDSSLWSSCPRRSWCNDIFKNALPTELQNLLKMVTKNTYRYSKSTSYRTQQTTDDYCFIPSEFEVFGVAANGSSYYGSGDDGNQYKYYETASNRIKGNTMEFTRTGYTNTNSSWGGYMYIHYNDSSKGHSSNANNTYAICPAFCI